MNLCFRWVIFLSFFILFSCRSTPEVKNSFIPSFSTYQTDTSQVAVPAKKNEIFYGTLTPVEISIIFTRLNLSYNNAIMNPVSNNNKYLSSAKTAINTGIYGVDFSYLKLFGVGQEMIDYAIAIREMSIKLGIPDEFLTSTLKMIQENNQDPDTMLSFMNKAFLKMNSHLRKSGRESSAGLIIMGGWIEAMFIATQLVYDPSKPDPEVVQKIAEQKYTLNSLLSLIKNYYDDPVVVYYSKKLKYLNNYFDSIDIYFKKGDLEIDTVKQVFRASGSEMNVSVETLNQIRNYIASLRTEMITP